jgi:hypothetical protein
LKTIKLPKFYLNEGGNYPQHKNKQKISYSQIGSFKDYKAQYIQGYFLGNKSESGMFAFFGNLVGTYFSDGEKNEKLSIFDMKTINQLVKHDTSKYESELVIDLEPFGLKDTVIQGFSDHEYISNDKLYIEDLKTGACKSMMEKYGDMQKYYQTRMYAYQRGLEGFEIGGCRVNHLDRKGNNLVIGDKNCLRLTGQIDYIPTPYKKEDVENYLKNTVVPVCKEVSEYYECYLKYFAK